MNRAKKEITLIDEELVIKCKVCESYDDVEISDLRIIKGYRKTLWILTQSLVVLMYYCDIKKAVKNNRAVILYRHNKMYVIDGKSLLYVIRQFRMNRYLCSYDLFNMNSINAFMHLL